MTFDADAKQKHVMEQLRLLPKVKSGTKFTLVMCPWHSERTPSCRVNHDTMKPRSIGWAKCYGCGNGGPWNEFAAVTQLEPYGSHTEASTPQAKFDNLDSSLLEEEKVELANEQLEFYGLIQHSEFLLGTATQWRGFDLPFLESLGCKVAYSRIKNRYFLWIPCNVNHSLVGYVKAMPKKWKMANGKKGPSYLNASGYWSRTKGLLFYDESRALMHRLKLESVVIVEGPRDALRLLSENIPAIAILGTQSWSSDKVFLLQAFGATRFIVCTDGDKAGRDAAKLLKTGKRIKLDGELVPVALPLTGAVDELKIFPLWKYAPPDPEDDPYDPCSMPEEVLEDLRELII